MTHDLPRWGQLASASRLQMRLWLMFKLTRALRAPTPLRLVSALCERDSSCRRGSRAQWGPSKLARSRLRCEVRRGGCARGHGLRVEAPA